MTKIMQEARKFVYVACKNEVNPKIKGVLPENRVCLLVDVEPKDTIKPKSRRKDLLLATSKENTWNLSQRSVFPDSKLWEVLTKCLYSNIFPQHHIRGRRRHIRFLRMCQPQAEHGQGHGKKESFVCSGILEFLSGCDSFFAGQPTGAGWACQ